MNRTRKTLVVLMVVLISSAALAKDPVDYVDPMIGTHGGVDPSFFYGGMIPAVGSPFAMIQWTPMTRLNRISVNPFRYGNKEIIGFLGTRQPAIWMGDYGYVSVMPGVGEVKHQFASRGLKYFHSGEVSTPYYYSLVAEGIRTEMTGAERAAIFRITFPSGETPWVVVDAIRSDEFKGAVEVDAEKMRITGYNPDRFSAHLGPPLPNFKGWFVVEFDRPFKARGTYNGDKLSPGVGNAEGGFIGAYAEFQDTDEPLLVRIGTSLISLEQAEDNLAREIPGWDFDAVKESTRRAWNEQLSRIEVDGSDDEKAVFYTALYRAHQFPRVFSEYGRYYSAFDDQIHDGVAYNDFSLWDTFRAEHPLLILTAPERVPDMVTALVQMSQQGGWLPKWPNPTYTGIMVGDHAASVIADAWVKGIRGFDLGAAYAAVYKNAMVPPDGDEHNRWHDRAPFAGVESRAGLTWYLTLGYVPADKTDESVSNTLEYAYDDFCVAQLARAAGKDEDYEMFMKRSKNYQNLWRGRWFEAKNSDGTWAGKGGYTESTGWGYLFTVMQDLPGLIDLMGGPRAFERRLDSLFAPVFRLYRYIHMNEPQHHCPYLYDYVGAAWKTQREVRRIMREQYFNSPRGLLGTDDCGQMSSWFVFSALGFYPVTPGSDLYAIGSPLLKGAILHLADNKTFTITVRHQSPLNIYIQRATLNGQPLPEPFLHHADIMSGGELVFEMGPLPKLKWGN